MHSTYPCKKSRSYFQNFDSEVENIIRSKSRKENRSLNQTLKEFLSLSVGKSPGQHSNYRDDFAEFCGVWSEQDLEVFNGVVAEFDQVDPNDWQ